MKRIAFILAVVSFAAAIVSCSKDYPQYQEAKEAFLFNDVKYNTMQEAINAAVALDNDDSTVEHYIKLLTNTSGPGAIVPDTFYEYIILDFGKFSYEITGGGSISIGNASLTLTGEGGYLFNPNKQNPLLCAEDGNIYIEKDIALAAEGEVIRTSSNVFVEENFTGEIKGEISIIQDDAQQTDYYNFEYLSTKGSMEIGKLTLKGKDATFEVREKLDHAGAIFIGELRADSQNALRAVDKASVRIAKGGTVHIHNWEMVEHIEASCVSDEYIVWKCSGCGETRVELIENETEGKCPADSLIHHVAVEASQLEEGNIEYWECPFCGTLYADAKAQTKLQGNPYIEPIFEKDDDQWEVEYETEPLTKADKLNYLCNAGSIAGMLISIGFTCYQFMQAPERMAKIQGIETGIVDFKQKLGDVANNLKNKMEANACQEMLYHRWDEVDRLCVSVEPSWKAVLDTMSNEKISLEAKTSAVTNTLTKWHDKNPEFNRNLNNCLEKFYSGEKIFSTIPMYAEKFQNNKQKWEHLGYGWRTNYMATDLSKILICCSMEFLYQELVGMKDEKVVAENKIKQLQNNLSLYYKEYQRDSTRMATRNAKYRVFVSGKYNETYEKEAKNVDVRGWFASHRGSNLDFDAGSKPKYRYRQTLDQLIKDLGMENLMSPEAANIGGEDKSGQRYQGLANVGFTNFKGSYKDNLLLLDKKHTEKCSFRSNHNPFNSKVHTYYKFFHWMIYLGRSKDYVCLDNVLGESGKTESLDIMNGANIYSRYYSNDFGKIKDMGTYREKRPIKIIKKAAAEEKAEALK